MGNTISVAQSTADLLGPKKADIAVAAAPVLAPEVQLPDLQVPECATVSLPSSVLDVAAPEPDATTPILTAVKELIAQGEPIFISVNLKHAGT